MGPSLIQDRISRVGAAPESKKLAIGFGAVALVTGSSEGTRHADLRRGIDVAAHNIRHPGVREFGLVIHNADGDFVLSDMRLAAQERCDGN